MCVCWSVSVAVCFTVHGVVCADPTAAEKLPRDKQRVLVFKEQVPDLHYMPAAEVAKLLADNIIFENGIVHCTVGQSQVGWEKYSPIINRYVI